MVRVLYFVKKPEIRNYELQKIKFELKLKITSKYSLEDLQEDLLKLENL